MKLSDRQLKSVRLAVIAALACIVLAAAIWCGMSFTRPYNFARAETRIEVIDGKTYAIISDVNDFVFYDYSVPDAYKRYIENTSNCKRLGGITVDVKNRLLAEQDTFDAVKIIIPEDQNIVCSERCMFLGQVDFPVEVEMPSSLRVMGYSTFDGNFQTITLKEGLRYIDGEFNSNYTKSIKEISLPSSVEYIDCGVFLICIKLVQPLI